MRHGASRAAARRFGAWAERGGRTGRAEMRSCSPNAALEAEQTWRNKALGLGGRWEAGVVRRQLSGQGSRGKAGMKEGHPGQGRTMRMNLGHNEEVQLMAPLQMWDRHTVWAWG